MTDEFVEHDLGYAIRSRTRCSILKSILGRGGCRPQENKDYARKGSDAGDKGSQLGQTEEASRCLLRKHRQAADLKHRQQKHSDRRFRKKPGRLAWCRYRSFCRSKCFIWRQTNRRLRLRVLLPPAAAKPAAPAPKPAPVKSAPAAATSQPSNDHNQHPAAQTCRRLFF